MENKLSDLRGHLFDTIRKLKDGTADIATAKTIADLAQVVINSAKVEVDFLKVTGEKKGTGFIEQEIPSLPAAPVAQLVKR